VRLDLARVGVRYGGVEAVRDIDLSIAGGEILALLGPNGSGKTSLIRAIAGLVPMTGRLLFDQRPERPRDIGYMPQDIATQAALTVLEVVLLGRFGKLGLRVGRHDLAAVQGLLADLGIAALAGRQVTQLSGGQRQLVFLAQALAAHPRLLLLDEPISALDIRHQLEVMEMLRRVTRERGITTITILHDLNVAARFADQIVMMRAGACIAAGPVETVLTPALVEQAFEVVPLVFRAPDGRLLVTPLHASPHR